MNKLLSLLKRITTNEVRLEKSANDELTTREKEIEKLLGDKIIEAKTHLELRNVDNWLDTNISFLKLEKNGIITFPYAGSETFVNANYNKEAKPILPKFQKIIYGQIIRDLYFKVDPKTKEFDLSSGIFELENDYILEEERMAPFGILGANMFCKTLSEFENQILENDYLLYSVRDKSIKYSR